MTSARRPWRFSTCLSFGLILALGAVLRFWHLDRQSFWLDEVQSAESIMGRGFVHWLVPAGELIDPAPTFTDPTRAAPWWRILTAGHGRTGDMHPPLPYVLLRLWCGAFGYSDTALRAWSALASLAGVWLLFLVGRELHGDSVALWACLLMAVAGPQIEYAREAKHYALLQAFALAACVAVVRIEKHGGTPARFVAAGLAVAAMLLTHYLSVGPIAALFAYACLRLRGRDRQLIITAFCAAGGFFLVAWGPRMLGQVRFYSGQPDWFRDAAPGFYRRELCRLLELPYRLLNEPPPNSEVASYGAGIACLLPVLLCRRRPEFLLWALWIPAVILTVVALDLARTSWLLALVRYSLLAGPGLYVVLAAVGARFRHPAARVVLPLVCVASCLVALSSAYDPFKADFRGMGRELMSRAKAGEPTVFCSEDDALVYMLGVSHYARPMPGPVALLAGRVTPGLLAELRRHERVWVVGDTDDVEQFLPGAEPFALRLFPGTGYLLGVRWPETNNIKAPAPATE